MAPLAILIAFSAYASALTSFTLTYRLSPIHPLAKYPGPVLAKTSKLWSSYLSATGEMHRHFKSLHDHYGDVVRVGPNELSIRDASLIHPILGQGGLPKVHVRWEGREGPPMLVAQSDPVLHMEQRKPWTRAFSSAAMKEYEIIVAKRIRQLVGCLEELVERSDGKANAVVDMTRWLKYFPPTPRFHSTDFMGDMAFGGGFEIMKAGRDVDGLWTRLEVGIGIAAILSHVPYMFPLFTSITGKRSPLVRLRAFCKERAVERLRIGAKRKDLFYYLVSLARIFSESSSHGTHRRVVGVIAGSDTTSAYERLQAEVDGAFPRGEEPLDVTKLSQMEWLNGCINETLRLQPPVPSGTLAPYAKVKAQKIIPEETHVALHTYSIQRDSRNFHTPDAFIPERWFCAGAPNGEHNTAAFFPFSYGPANCAGKNLALMEMRMLLCWVLRRFSFSEVPGVNYEEWEGKILDWLFAVHQSPLMMNRRTSWVRRQGLWLSDII
ncbi:cytochrome P450 [Lactarius quietus]|nr:cytochrome P450 [Lactarius quietus]